jgi:hypothetical protein
MTTNDDTAPVSPAALLRQVGALRRRARADRRGYWVPLLIFGVLTLGSLPLYVEHWSCAGNDLCTVSGYGWSALDRIGGGVLGDKAALGWYWLAALLAGGLATVGWYRWQAQRRGVQGRIGIAVAAGLVGVAALFAAGLTWFPPYLAVVSYHGTAAFLVIAFGLLGLAWLERSIALGVVAVGYSVAAGFAMFYDMVNVFYRIGWEPPDGYHAWPNVLVPALVLLAGAGIGALSSYLSRS